MTTTFGMKLQSPDYDGRGRTVYDAAMTNGSGVLTSATAAFTAADVGARAIVVGAGVGGATLETTVSGYTSATQVTLAAAASTTVANKAARVGSGYEISLPATSDSYNGDSMAAIIALFDGENEVLDFKQLREVINLLGVITTPAVLDAGLANVIQMRDELRRIRASEATLGLNIGSARSWIQEGTSGYAFTAHLDGAGARSWGSTTLPADERDSSTLREASTCRLIWDQYWNPATQAYGKLFVYGTVSGVNFQGRPGATTITRIPFSVTFLAGNINVGEQ